MPVITVYKQDGSKERFPVGYAGKRCHAATAAFEKYDVPGSVRKTPTDEAYVEPATEAVEATEEQRVH
jgi:hypothetical protein